MKLVLDTAKGNTSNRNVPPDAFLFFTVESCGNEIREDYYADKEGNLFSVTDWKGHKPFPITMSKLAKSAIEFGVPMSDKALESAFDYWKTGQ